MQKEIAAASVITNTMATGITAETIRMARSRLEYNQIELANRSHLCQSKISRIERDLISLDVLRVEEPHQYQNLLRALGLDKIAICIVELEHFPDISSVLTQEN